MPAMTRPVVWLVDDTESVRKSLTAVLETADMQVRGYSSADAFFKEFTPAANALLVVDHFMPDMNGLELLLELQRKKITVPSIVITGNADTGLEDKVKKAGALMMLHKPVDGDELITLIEKIMAKKS